MRRTFRLLELFCFLLSPSTPAGLNRKIIYNAEIELAVEDFTGVPDRVIALGGGKVVLDSPTSRLRESELRDLYV